MKKERSFFSCFSLQTAQFMSKQMLQCGYVHRELEKSMILQNQLWSFWCFHHQKDLAHRKVHSGIIVCRGRELLMQAIALPLHQHQCLFTSALENSGVIWTTATWLTPKPPRGFAKPQNPTSNNQHCAPFLVICVSQWTAVESAFS